MEDLTNINSSNIPNYFKYWGKAKQCDDGSYDYHLLPYHSLDVAAVADVWWEKSPSLKKNFIQLTETDEPRAKAWVLFFIALHDYGKFDVRFQLKAPLVAEQLIDGCTEILAVTANKEIKDYNHGPAGVFWLQQDFSERFDADDWMDDSGDDWEVVYQWMSAVGGHHGGIPEKDGLDERYSPPFTINSETIEQESKVRISWIQVLSTLFLAPLGLSFSDCPPRLIPVTLNKSEAKNALAMLAGFCSISDWIGSSAFFPFDSQPVTDLLSLTKWYQTRYEFAEKSLKSSGLISEVNSEPQLDKLLNGFSPRQVQYLLPELELSQSLTLIEASTGSGKTEAALFHAWQLLSAGLADSIIFALPTQATANAMLNRIEKAANIIFKGQTNLVLAHGRSKYQQEFIDLKSAAVAKTVQNGDEAWVQCGQWLAQSRKRVFLGQLGVCTIDQVLISVLPIKHKFVRGFGIGRSVLIVDEVHAYDSYMYGLLSGVLAQQRIAGGSAILLSATLPISQKKQLVKAWQGSELSPTEAYPLITQISNKNIKTLDLIDHKKRQPIPFSVNIELLKEEELLPSTALINEIVNAVKLGAQVCFICNLVDVAQQLYSTFQQLFLEENELKQAQLILFHSRFTFTDRQAKEDKVLAKFGSNSGVNGLRNKGHLLIATQVVEQSLDIDFDWMLTQLCPVDLLFQRLGRLHRHQNSRPQGFETRRCTILAPEQADYSLHAIIYGNSRVLWRTEQMLAHATENMDRAITFPDVYRPWIESVYQEQSWESEPLEITKSYERFLIDQDASRMTAIQNINRNFSLDDTDANTALLTRDGEMSLNIVPVTKVNDSERLLLNGKNISALDQSTYFETLNLNSVAVPASWRGKSGDLLPESDENGVLWLEMEHKSDCWLAYFRNKKFRYCHNLGLRRTELKKEYT